jgi:glycosyltransferase involved in cell wall biosynthesis
MKTRNATPLRIAIVSLQYLETSTGGGGVHVNSVVEQLVHLKQHITVLSIHTNRTFTDEPNQLFHGVSYSKDVHDYLTVIRFELEKELDHPYVGDKKTELNRIKLFTKICLEWLREHENEFDIINLHGHHLIPGKMAKELVGIKPKVVSYVHALETTYVTESGEFVGAFGGGEILKEMRSWEAQCRYADIIVGNSAQVKNEIIDIIGEFSDDLKDYRSKLRIIPSGCPENFLMDDKTIISKTVKKPDIIRMVSFCRIDPSKGVEFSIIGAQGAALESDQEFHLTIAGIPASRKYADSLQSLATNSPENLTVEFCFLSIISPTDEKKEILDDKHIYILPTLKEPFGMSLVEASARGNMIVSTDTNGPKDIFGNDGERQTEWGKITERGLMVAITDDHKKNLANNIASAILYVSDHWNEGRERILNFNRKIRSTWVWEEIGKEYLRLFYSCLN